MYLMAFNRPLVVALRLARCIGRRRMPLPQVKSIRCAEGCIACCGEVVHAQAVGTTTISSKSQSPSSLHWPHMFSQSHISPGCRGAFRSCVWCVHAQPGTFSQHAPFVKQVACGSVANANRMKPHFRSWYPYFQVTFDATASRRQLHASTQVHAGPCARGPRKRSCHVVPEQAADVAPGRPPGAPLRRRRHASPPAPG